jgi:hypothetical protein
MRPARAGFAALMSVVIAASGAAQSGARVAGTVTDSSSRPMYRADVIVMGTERHVRTDSAGRFVLDSLPGGKFTVRARHVGYGPAEWTVDVPKNGRAEVHLVLGARLALLDTVKVEAGRPCSPSSVEGFLCRRARGTGAFLDYYEIDDLNALYSADVFRAVEGFTVTVLPTRVGPKRVPMPDNKQCLNVLIDGKPGGFNSMPGDPYDLTAIEVYRTPQDTPREFARYTWGKERCWMVVVWTVNKGIPLPRAKLPLLTR